MNLTCSINNKTVSREVAPDMMLLDFLRSQGCYSVKCGCETTNCGLCTVWMNGKPVLSCAVPALRAGGCEITTLEGVREEAEGFCSPGFIMSVLAMKRELSNPDDREIREYLAGNLCRCTGYAGQMRAVRKYLEAVGRQEAEKQETEKQEAQKS